MTRNHILDAYIGYDCLNLALRCPYDDEPDGALADYPDWMIPVCRPDRADTCTAADAVADGRLLHLWGGPPAVLAHNMAVQIWRDDSGLHLTAAPTTAVEAPVEHTARELARASRSPRYAGDKWTMLLTSESNVDHAWREAIRHDVDPATADLWRRKILDWQWTPGPQINSGAAHDTDLQEHSTGDAPEK